MMNMRKIFIPYVQWSLITQLSKGFPRLSRGLRRFLEPIIALGAYKSAESLIIGVEGLKIGTRPRQ